MTETLSPDHPVRTLLVALEGDVPDHAVCAVRELVADLQAQDTWTVAPPSFVEGLDAVVELDGEEIGAILQGRPTQGITDGLVGEWERILGLRFSPRSPD